MQFKINKKCFLFPVLILISTNVLAQEAAKSPDKSAPVDNYALMLAIVAAVLAFVIGGLGNVLIALGRQVIEKQKKEKTGIAKNLLLIVVFSLLHHFSFAQGTANAATKNADSGFWIFIMVIGIEVTVILFMLFFIRKLQADLLPAKAKKTYPVIEVWKRLDRKFFTKAPAVEKEADILLDHNYDGIRELDNALPPWWKYGFYITIIVAIIYLFNFHVMGAGKNPLQEYDAEMHAAKLELEQYEAKNKDRVDENNVPMADEAGLTYGREKFKEKCSVCHGDNAQGNVGPNLTDKYWLHKGSLNDIFKTIKNGYADKGMQAWDKDFNPKQISYLASYIKTLQGTNPAGAKAPQGELYEDAPVADSILPVKASVPLMKKDTAVKK
jgi:cytochrome c oxidase cbb3-type subunit 3